MVTKAEKEQQDKELQKRKDKNKELGYKYKSCKYCGQAPRFRGDVPFETCGDEDCARKFAEDKRKEMKEKSS